MNILKEFLLSNNKCVAIFVPGEMRSKELGELVQSSLCAEQEAKLREDFGAELQQSSVGDTTTRGIKWVLQVAYPWRLKPMLD